MGDETISTAHLVTLRAIAAEPDNTKLQEQWVMRLQGMAMAGLVWRFPEKPWQPTDHGRRVLAAADAPPPSPPVSVEAPGGQFEASIRRTLEGGADDFSAAEVTALLDEIDRLRASRSPSGGQPEPDRLARSLRVARSLFDADGKLTAHREVTRGWCAAADRLLALVAAVEQEGGE